MISRNRTPCRQPRVAQVGGPIQPRRLPGRRPRTASRRSGAVQLGAPPMRRTARSMPHHPKRHLDRGTHRTAGLAGRVRLIRPEQPTITPTSQLMITIDAVVTCSLQLRRNWPEFERASCDHQGRDHERRNATQGCLEASTFRTPWVHLEVEVSGYGSRGTSA